MVNAGKGRLFKRKDGKFLIYLPKDLCEDSMFPFKITDYCAVNIKASSSATARCLSKNGKNSKPNKVSMSDLRSKFLLRVCWGSES